MPIRRRPNGSWLVDVWVDGRNVRKTLPADTDRATLRAMERQLGSEGRAPVERRTLRHLTVRWWDEHGQHLAWHVSVRGHCARWEAAIGAATPLDEITSDLLARTVAGWRGQISDSTINRAVAVLRHAWRRAAEVWRWPMPSVPWRRLTLAEPEPVDRAMAEGTIEAWLAVWPERSRLLATMAAVTGLRRSAVLRLEAADLDWQRGLVHTISKGRAGGRAVVVPMTEGVLAVLMAYGSLPEGRLWPLTQGQLQQDIRRASTAAGMHGRFHSLRHSFAQRLEDAGEGDAVTDALHHSDPKLRRRYARASLDRVGQAIARANRR
jgi:integrase